MEPVRDVIDYYEKFAEESRLAAGASRLEFERTKEILQRLLPKPPARIVDVGGAAGVYSAWLAGLGYEVHLVDASERLVGEAGKVNATLAKPIASLSVGDARSLPQGDGFAEVVLVMGPLYHLTEAGDRLAALQEARRVVKHGGWVAVAGISRYASALHGLASGVSRDPAFARIRDRDLQNGQHRNDSGNIDYFTTAYFHRPEDLHQEMLDRGLRRREGARRRGRRLDGRGLRCAVGRPRDARRPADDGSRIRVRAVDARRQRALAGNRSEEIVGRAPGRRCAWRST